MSLGRVLVLKLWLALPLALLRLLLALALARKPSKSVDFYAFCANTAAAKIDCSPLSLGRVLVLKLLLALLALLE